VSQAEASIPSTLPLPRSRYRVLPRVQSGRRHGTFEPHAFIQMSRVGFDKTGTRAIVHRAHLCSGGDCGNGGDLFLEKQKGQWRVAASTFVICESDEARSVSKQNDWSLTYLAGSSRFWCASSEVKPWTCVTCEELRLQPVGHQ
jgi:hypothetical protein